MQTMAAKSWNPSQPETMVIAPRLDCDAAIDFEQDAMICIQRGAREFVLNCSALTELTGAGLRSILVIAREVSQVHGKMVICNLQGQPREIFESCGFNELIPSYGNQSEAFARLAA